MTPAQRVNLDRRIGDERMIEIDPHGAEPWEITSHFSWQPLAMCMTPEGDLLPGLILLDEVPWHRVAAIRLFQPSGPEIDIPELGEYDDWEGFREPAPAVQSSPAMLGGPTKALIERARALLERHS